MISFIVWICVGGLIGWLGSIVMRTATEQGTLLNIVVGAVGAFVAGLVSTQLLGVSAINHSIFSRPAWMAPLLGASILLAGVSIFRRGFRQQR